MDGQTADLPVSKTEQRRSGRFPVVVPVDVKWQELNGNTVSEAAQVKVVNAEGGLLEMKTYPRVGAKLQLTNLLSSEAAEARVVGIRRSKQGAIVGVAVELLVPSEAFWGLNFQLRKTSADLARLGEAIKSGGVEPRILRDFRDSVDYVRKTAWAVQEWQERQLQRHDPHTLLPLLTTERVRRATQLSKAVMTDMDGHAVSRETVGLDELFRAVESLSHRLADLFKEREA